MLVTAMFQQSEYALDRACQGRAAPRSRDHEEEEEDRAIVKSTKLMTRRPLAAETMPRD